MLPNPIVVCISLCIGWSVIPLRSVTPATTALPTSLAYVLQADALGETPVMVADKLRQAQRDWIVLDPHFSADVDWAVSDLKLIRSGNPQRKIIAYISIGEAEDYRPYWKKGWLKNGEITAQTPIWLLHENPEWKGNFVVKYWNNEWQIIILKAVHEAMAQGFDGVYLDIVDGFETFETVGKDYDENRLNPATKQSYRCDMIDWVKKIAVEVRAQKADALVIPQNGSALLGQDDFLATISAIGIEGLYTNDDKKQPKRGTREILDNLKKVLGAKKPVLLIEYPQTAELKDYAQQRAREDGLILLLTDRELKNLGTSSR